MEKVHPDTRVRVFEERRAAGRVDAPLTSTEMSWLVAPPTVGDQRLRFYAMLFGVGVFAESPTPAEELVAVKTVQTVKKEEPIAQRIRLMNGKQLQGLWFTATLLRGIREASRLFGDSPFLAKRYSTPERLMAWMDKHPDFTPCGSSIKGTGLQSTGNILESMLAKQSTSKLYPEVSKQTYRNTTAETRGGNRYTHANLAHPIFVRR